MNDEILNLAETVFGSKAQAEAWLYDYNQKLNATPISLLETEAGTNAVRETLASILHGCAA